MTEDVLKRLDELEELKKNSTEVNQWYANGATVRGPFDRWFEITEVPDAYKKNVAYSTDDAKYAAAAMNSLPQLIKALRLAVGALDSIEWAIFDNGEKELTFLDLDEIESTKISIRESLGVK